MKAKLALSHGTFERYFPPVTQDPDFLALAHSIAALARGLLHRLSQALRPVSFEEAYLAQAQNCADLERRLFELQYPNDKFSTWH